MSLCKKLNIYLANQQAMFIKLHNLHWYIEGNSFFSLHTKFEELYNETAQIIDDVAERMLALGHKPVGSMKNILPIITVEELGDCPINTKDALHQIITDTEYWIRDSKEIITLAENEGDNVTADMFIGYVGEYEKLLWMLKSFDK